MAKAYSGIFQAWDVAQTLGCMYRTQYYHAEWSYMHELTGQQMSSNLSFDDPLKYPKHVQKGLVKFLNHTVPIGW